MGKKQDHHSRGQHDYEKSRKDGWIDLIVHGGSSPHYNPPKDRKSRTEYNAGWNNAKRK